MERIWPWSHLSLLVYQTERRRGEFFSSEPLHQLHAPGAEARQRELHLLDRTFLALDLGGTNLYVSDRRFGPA